MRQALVLALLAAIAVPALAQRIPMVRLPFDQGPDDRIDIEIVPVLVLGQGTADLLGTDDEEDAAEVFFGLYAQVSDVFGSTHDALHTLGVQPDEYNLTLGSEMHALICADATVYSEQACAHLELGLIDDLPDFMHDLYDRKAPERGTVQLSVVILEDEVAWRGLVGYARFWWWGRRSDNHWTRTACRAWALHSVPVIAHELGHCFMLRHNEDDTDSGLDLMVSRYAHFDWVKGSNKDIVRRHFRYPTPEQGVSTTQPQTELVF